MATITRRQFAQLAARAATLSLGGLLAACTNGDAGKGDAKPEEGVSAGTDTSKQVIVTMTPSFGAGGRVRPARVAGAAASTCTSRSSSPRSSPPTPSLEFVNDLATSYECSEDGLDVDLHHPRRREIHRRRAPHRRATWLSPSTASTELRCFRGRPHHGEGGRGHRRHHGGHQRWPSPSTPCCTRLPWWASCPSTPTTRPTAPTPSARAATCSSSGTAASRSSSSANPDYYGEAPLHGARAWWCSWRRTPRWRPRSRARWTWPTPGRDARGPRSPPGYGLLDCTSVDSRGISLPCRARRRHARSDDGVRTYPAGNDVTCDLARAPGHQLRPWTARRSIGNVLNGYGTRRLQRVATACRGTTADMEVRRRRRQRRRAARRRAAGSPGADGVRAKGGVRAAFDLYYAAGDSVRQALANEFANQMRAAWASRSNIKGASWDDLYPHQCSDPVMWGWGSNAPVEMYDAAPTPPAPGNYACYENATVDAYLDEALAQPRVEDSYRVLAEGAVGRRDGLRPAGRRRPWVWFANVDHLYFTREGLNGGRAEAAPARARLVAREQRRPVDVGLAPLPTRDQLRARSAPVLLRLLRRSPRRDTGRFGALGVR